jgi:hypothetical protein
MAFSGCGAVQCGVQVFVTAMPSKGPLQSAGLRMQEDRHGCGALQTWQWPHQASPGDEQAP